MSPQHEADSSENQIDILKQILDVLQNSTIAEERGRDLLSKFWAAYKRVSNEYDSDILERCNDDMSIVLIFAGLFSAVNTAFIIAMQPNPADTTNALLVQFIQISLQGSSAVQPTTLLAPTPGYSSAKSWIQMLGYASLVFSLLAAFGAVLGKQWLGYYKTHSYGLGSLEERCKQRHCKFKTLEAWHFHKILQSFPLLLQLSLFLFGLSIGSAMWTQQLAISVLIIATTGFGFLFYLFIIVASVRFPDCPFQTPISLAIQAIFCHFHRSPGSQSPDRYSATSAMQWILETSTNPDVIRSAVELIPTMSDQPLVDIKSLCEEVRDMFMACFDSSGTKAIHQESALEYGKALIHLSCNHPEVRDMLRDSTKEWKLWGSWRALYFPQALEQCLTSYERMEETMNKKSQEYHQADLHTALRMAVASGIDEFTDPNDARLVWDGQFHYFPADSPDKASHTKLLLKCVKHFYDAEDYEVAGHALLLAICTLHKDIMSSQHFADFISEFFTPILLLWNTPHQSSGIWRFVALHMAQYLVDDALLAAFDKLLSQVVLMTAFSFSDSTFPNTGDIDNVLFTDAVDLLSLARWPKGHSLEHSPLPVIQRLVLNALRHLPTPTVHNATQYMAYCRLLNHHIVADDPDFRHSALCSAYSNRWNLASIVAAKLDGSQQDTILSKFSRAMLLVTTDGRLPIDYLRLISTLATSPSWRNRLFADRHVERCITQIRTRTTDSSVLDDEEETFYLVDIFFRVYPHDPSGQEASYEDIEPKSLLKKAWSWMTDPHCHLTDIDTEEIVPTLAHVTERYILDYPQRELASLRCDLTSARYGILQASGDSVTSAVAKLHGIITEKINENQYYY